MAQAGAEAIATDLASALFVMVVRHLYRENAQRTAGIALHRQLSHAVAAMVDDPARNWTLDELAACANASRASLVRMLRGTAQQSPVAFLAKFRVELTAQLSATALPSATIGRGRLQLGKCLQPRLPSPLWRTGPARRVRAFRPPLSLAERTAVG